MRIIQHRDALDIYDPRKGEEKRIDMYNKQIFSSLNSNFLVIEAYRKMILFESRINEFKFKDIDPIMKRSIVIQDGLGFFSFAPFAEKARKSGIIELNNVDHMNNSILGYFEVSESLDQIIEKHRNILSYEEWIIGSCVNKFKKSAHQDELAGAFWNIDFLLMQADNINCLYYYNSDMNFIIFMTRLFKELDEELSVLNKKRLNKKGQE